MLFPGVDPIPLPAPVWLMKALSLLTLTLHFAAVQLVFGCLLAACILNFMGMRGSGAPRAAYLSASLALARRLPVAMTYLINFGIPPLLFAQVLYGRALYTSSVLMGALWIAVIPILTFGYWFLYRMTDRISQGRAGWVYGLAALLMIMTIGQIFSFNMTLMLRPEVWQDMYAHSASGLQTPPHDPTTGPRLCFMLLGGLTVGGAGLMLTGLARTIAEDAQALLRRTGGTMSLLGVPLQIGCAFWLLQTQHAGVVQGLSASPLYMGGAIACLVGLVLVLAMALLGLVRKGGLLPAIGAALGGVVAVAGEVIYRDGIRDLTLRSHGFDVWQRTVVANWSVIILFLLLLVASLGIIGWLISVVARARPLDEAAPTEPIVSIEEGVTV